MDNGFLQKREFLEVLLDVFVEKIDWRFVWLNLLSDSGVHILLENWGDESESFDTLGDAVVRLVLLLSSFVLDILVCTR